MKMKVGIAIVGIVLVAAIGGVWGSGVLNHPIQTTTTTTTSPYCPATLSANGHSAYTASNSTLSVPITPNQDIGLARWTIGPDYLHPTQSGTFTAGTKASLVELSPIQLNASTTYYVTVYDTCPTQDSLTVPVYT